MNQTHKQALLIDLEGLLAREFRACQSLQSLTKEERAALIRNDTRALLAIVDEKEALLDELGRIEDDRRMTVLELDRLLDARLDPPSVGGLLPMLDTTLADSLQRLCEGIAAVGGQIRETNHGNQALAVSALERMDAVQIFLLSFFQSPCGYQPLGYQPPGYQSTGAPMLAQSPAVSLEADQRA
jgi:flagellar biosynthesis/type III secretory pathway chaperone